MPTALYTDQSRLTRPWRPSNLYGNLPGLARMYGQDALTDTEGQDSDPVRKRLNELGAQAASNGTSTRIAELAARLGRGGVTGNLKSIIPSETSTALQSGGASGVSNPYLDQLTEIGKIGTNATAIQRARQAFQNQQQAANTPTGGKSSSGGFDIGGVPSGARQRAIKNAMTQIGVPYVWGGTSPGKGLDCSGLVQWAYGKAGIRLPRVSQDQMTRGVRTPINKLVPGDLIGWGRPAHHIAIYLGNGRILEAPRTGLKVRVVPLSQKGGGAWGIHLRI